MAEITLRDGSTTTDPRLDRLEQFDARSRQYGISEVLPEGFKSKTWRLKERLDQGNDGACVGFGNTHRIAALPISFGGATNDYALKIYHEAQKIDPWEGEDYEGTSVLAGVKVAQRLGHFSQYRWCFSVDDYLRAVAHEGPVIVGSSWFNDMFEPDERGLLHPTGSNAGGHCWIIRGLTLKPGGARSGVGPVFRMTNSWGSGWGTNGEAWITVEDFERHIFPNAEGCVPTEQHVARTTTEENPVEDKVGKGKHPWKPGGASSFNRVLGYGYTKGAAQARLSGHGKPAGIFKKGPFRLGR
jgi:hypothetical protein